MQVVFILVSLAGAAWFLFARRRVDLFTMAYFASVVYFIPGYAGFDLFLSPLDPRMYTIFSLVLAGVWLSAALYRRQALSPPPREGGAESWALTLAAVVVVAFVLTQYGYAVLLQHKSLSPIPGPVSIAWRVTCSLGFVIACTSRQWRAAAVSGALLMLMFVASDRTAVAMVMVALGVEGFRRYGAIRLGPRLRRAWLPGIAALVLLWGGKIIHVSIQAGYREGSVAAAVEFLRTPGVGDMLLVRSEPFNTQSLLNATLQNDLEVGPEHLLDLPFMLWIAPSMFGYSSAAFNDAAQEFFPQIRRRSMAYNFWAEGFASGGWAVFALYLLTYVAGIWALDRLSQTRSAGWRGIWLLMGAYWAFYVHRNSMASIITYEKHVFYVGAAVMLVVALLPRTRESPRPAAPPRRAPALSAPAGTPA
jgi:hypothetical protein